MPTTSSTDLADDERARLAGTTLVAALADVAARAPGAVAFHSTSGDVTFAALVSRARRIANGLLARGCDGPVAVVGGNEPDTYVALIGAMHAGRMAVPLDPRETPEQLADRASRLGALVTGVDADLLVRIAAARDVEAIAIGDVDGPDAPPAIDLRGSDPALGYFTSGSTGEPKAVPIPHSWAVLIGSIIELS